MNHQKTILLALSLASATLAGTAHAQAHRYTITAGPAHAAFNVSSSDLSGPPGTTPPGARMSVDDLSTLGIEATMHLTDRWSASLAFGAPPKAHFRGEGVAAPLGRIGSARAWFPAVLASYRFNAIGPVQPYVGAGINYTFYTGVQVGDNYTAAFGGTSSSGKVKAAFGPVVKLGALLPLSDGWVINAGWARYGIRSKATVTTQTPGFGPIARKATVDVDPDVFSLLIGRSF